LKVLVTEALDFVGSNLVDLLVNDGHEVLETVNLGSLSSSNYWRK